MRLENPSCSYYSTIDRLEHARGDQQIRHISSRTSQGRGHGRGGIEQIAERCCFQPLTYFQKPIIGEMDKFHTDVLRVYDLFGLQFGVGEALLFLFCGLVILSFFISFFCCAPRFGPPEEDIEQASLRQSPPSP